MLSWLSGALTDIVLVTSHLIPNVAKGQKHIKNLGLTHFLMCHMHFIVLISELTLFVF